MIILAREARGISQYELANAIGMSATNLSKVERGDVMLGDEYLEPMAEAVHFPPQFFYRPGEILPVHLGYRRRMNVPIKLLNVIHAQINVVRLHVEMLTPLVLPKYHLRLPRHEVTDKLSPAKIAEWLRREWEVEKPIIPNVVKVLEDKGIVTIPLNLGTERVDSMHIVTKDNIPVIIYNKALTGDRQRFTLAYELGHLVMHSGNVSVDTDLSHEANAFAAAFLMPAKEIAADLQGAVTIPLLAAVKRKWKQSMISILHRADDLEMITFNQKRYLLQQFNQLRIRRREPEELDVPQEESKLMKRWIADYRSKTKLGTADMAAAFSLHTDEFLELYA